MCTFLRNLFARCFNWCHSKCQNEVGKEENQPDEPKQVAGQNNEGEEPVYVDHEPLTSAESKMPKDDVDVDVNKYKKMKVFITKAKDESGDGHAEEIVESQPTSKHYLPPPKQPWEKVNMDLE